MRGPRAKETSTRVSAASRDTSYQFSGREQLVPHTREVGGGGKGGPTSCLPGRCFPFPRR